MKVICVLYGASMFINIENIQLQSDYTQGVIISSLKQIDLW